MEFKHKSVLLDECIEGLNIKSDGIYVDGTLGGAGHSKEIVKRLSKDGLLIGIDRDTDALKAAKENLKEYENVKYVHGNHDEEVFPHYVVYKDIFVTHGNDYHVYSGYDELIEACKENNCHICFHGHTHVPTIQVHEGITVVNPGSAMINRGSYGYGTYAIVDTEPFNVIYYDNIDHHICNQEVLEEGMALLEEFKKIVKNMK